MKLTKQILKRLIMEELSEAWKDDESGANRKLARAAAEQRKLKQSIEIEFMNASKFVDLFVRNVSSSTQECH